MIPDHPEVNEIVQELTNYLNEVAAGLPDGERSHVLKALENAPMLMAITSKILTQSNLKLFDKMEVLRALTDSNTPSTYVSIAYVTGQLEALLALVSSTSPGVWPDVIDRAIIVSRKVWRAKFAQMFSSAEGQAILKQFSGGAS